MRFPHKVEVTGIQSLIYPLKCLVFHFFFYMQVLDEYLEFRNKFGPVDCLDTKTFFVGPKLASETEVSTLFSQN